ncbi:hypothetical protein, partial [Pseudomonas sp. O39]|uniref:hypothetical protein n=1 Tax=Pseudomonas sp. O39 TaxID=3379130 RepID=UPI00387B0975
LKLKLNQMWELACRTAEPLRWHQLGMPDVPRCLHRRQASSHRKAALFLICFCPAFASTTQVGFQAAVLCF